MLKTLLDHSPDLRRLRDEGYDIDEQAGHLLVRHVPYVNEQRQVEFGVLVTSLTLAGGNATTTPGTHAVDFTGSTPCDQDGKPLDRIINARQTRQLAAGLSVNFTFSSKPKEGYPDYYEKMTSYVRMLAGYAQAIDPTSTATTFPVIEATEDESVFLYIDTASSRAGIAAISEKLELGKVAIVGVGGTGAYILDLVAKTPVREIHLFDGDKLLQHNAFRSPGAPSVEDLTLVPMKVVYFRDLYSHMRRNIFAHEFNLDESNVEVLRDMDFVFVSAGDGATKRLIVEALEKYGLPFVDVGMGLYESESALAGLVRVTTSTPEQREHVWRSNRIPFAAAPTVDDDDYDQNIQIADLNALNATLAVVKWKKLFGFYRDLEREHFSVYEVDGNHILNEDQM